MAVFNKKKLLKASSTQIPEMAEAIRQEFLKDDYEVNIDTMVSGGRDISIAKGSSFKAVLGMRSALKVTLSPQINGILFDAHVGIFGQQLIPSVISMFFYWPVLITQIWGMVRQSELDDRALAAAERTINTAEPTRLTSNQEFMFCTHCGKKIDLSAPFCPYCGNKLS